MLWLARLTGMPSWSQMIEKWWEQAACATERFKDLATRAGAEHPTHIFYPITQSDSGRAAKSTLAAAKYKARQQRFDLLARTTCGDCPVRRECLLDACQNDGEVPHGFVGGLNPRQRVDLVEGAELISTKCPETNVTLWGTKKFPPPKRAYTKI